jgi:6-phosphogluconolactonase/glucosamine-6-phosphate isomerase/deaminase
MEFIQGNEKLAIELLSKRLSDELRVGKRVLWLICGGSNVPTAFQILQKVKDVIPDLSHLIVSQTDERYGPVGHKDSNWKQLLDLGFDASSAKMLPILGKEPIDDMLIRWRREIQGAFADADIVIAQFGMGADGHIAGLIPRSKGVEEKDAVTIYTTQPFVRMSLTFDMLREIDVAYAFVFGDAKREAVQNLKKNIPLADEPAQILKEIGEAYLVSDQLD